MIELIIVNLYGTIIPAKGEIILRKGFNSFFEKYEDKQFVISARKPKEAAQSDLCSIGLFDKVKLYSLEDMKKIVTLGFIPQEYDTLEKRAKYAGEVVTGKRRPEHYIIEPNLRNIIWEHKTTKEKTVLISDHPWDVDAADFDRIKMIHVPSFVDENDTFSFERVPIDSLRQRTTYFLQRLSGKPYKIELK